MKLQLTPNEVVALYTCLHDCTRTSPTIISDTVNPVIVAIRDRLRTCLVASLSGKHGNDEVDLWLKGQQKKLAALQPQRNDQVSGPVSGFGPVEASQVLDNDDREYPKRQPKQPGNKQRSSK